MTQEKAIILDKILLRFEGNKTIYWNDLELEFKDNMGEYYLTQNNITLLIGDGLMRRPDEKCLALTDKGFAVMTDLKTLGYVTKYKKERTEKTIKYATFGFSVLTFIILIIRFCFEIKIH